VLAIAAESQGVINIIRHSRSSCVDRLNAISDLATELREHSDSVALRVRDALDHAAREWKIQQFQYLKERERQLRESGRSDDADLTRSQSERLELPKARLALVIDQLEELFTTGFSPEVRQDYISAFAGLVRSGRVFVLATLRSDFYPRYQEFPDLIELAKPSGKFDLRPPTPYELGNMIRLPAEAAGLRFEQEQETGQRLDQALRDAASATPESLPLLEHVLSLLYDEQCARGDDLLRWSDYRQLGELTGALAKHAEAVFSTLQPHEQKAFPLMMRYLVTLGQGEEEVPNRRTVPYRDFVAAEGTDRDQKAGARGFVDLFIEKRLLVADTDPQGEVTVSVAHEALLREWQRVRDWLKQNREFLRMRDRLDASVRQWKLMKRHRDYLLPAGLPLAEAEKLVDEFGDSLNREQLDYISASIAEQRRKRSLRKRIRNLVAVCIALLVTGVAVPLGMWALRETASAFAMLEAAAQLDRLVAQKNFQRGEVAEALAYLARARRYQPKSSLGAEAAIPGLVSPPIQQPRITLDGHIGPVTSAVFSPDGSHVLTASVDHAARLWEADSGKLLATFQGHTNVITPSTAVAFFVPIRKGAEDAGQLLGAEVTYTGPPDFNIQKQVDFIKSAIAQNVVFGVEEVAGSAIAQIIDRDQLKGKVAGGSFDLVPEVLDAIEKGELQFTMDQQPYLQGYLSVINLYLLKRYSLTPTNINTGTVPVTWENVAKVKELVTQGYR
jgi:WD domain, G-beta repeat